MEPFEGTVTIRNVKDEVKGTLNTQDPAIGFNIECDEMDRITDWAS